MKKLSYFFVFCSLVGWSQDLPKQKTLLLEEVTILEKNYGFKKVGLYDEEEAKSYSIKGFSQLSIFDNDFSDEVWSTKNTACIQLNLKEDEKDKFLSVKWNKDQDGCDWVGMGFGWDMWAGKDMNFVKDTLAMELEVRAIGKSFTNIPWAFCFEDYSGAQAWLGYNKSFLLANEITSNWTKVRIPFSLFPFEENNFDLFNVKQLMVQVFGEGSIEINSIKLVPNSSKLRSEATCLKVNEKMELGKKENWNIPFTNFGAGHSFATLYTKDSLFISVKVNDATPQVNSEKDEKLWNGDAIEIAFSTNPQADPKRKSFLLSDQHLGINCGATPYIWDWKENKRMEKVKFVYSKTADGYFLELAIPVTELFKTKLLPEASYGFEIAVDLSGADGKRSRQERWNSIYAEGFHLSPSKWGTLICE